MKWLRHLYQPCKGAGTEGRMVSGSAEHIALSRRAAGEGIVLELTISMGVSTFSRSLEQTAKPFISGRLMSSTTSLAPYCSKSCTARSPLSTLDVI